MSSKESVGATLGWEWQIDALETRVEGLMTIIDFCNEVAGVGGKFAINDAHDLAHVLLGGGRTRKWDWMKDWLTMTAPPRDTTPAWPDVKQRMLELVTWLEDKE